MRRYLATALAAANALVIAQATDPIELGGTPEPTEQYAAIIQSVDSMRSALSTQQVGQYQLTRSHFESRFTLPDGGEVLIVIQPADTGQWQPRAYVEITRWYPAGN